MQLMRHIQEGLVGHAVGWQVGHIVRAPSTGAVGNNLAVHEVGVGVDK